MQGTERWLICECEDEVIVEACMPQSRKEVIVPKTASAHRLCELSPTGEKGKGDHRSALYFCLALLSLEMTKGEEQIICTFHTSPKRGVLQLSWTPIESTWHRIRLQTLA